MQPSSVVDVPCVHLLPQRFCFALCCIYLAPYAFVSYVFSTHTACIFYSMYLVHMYFAPTYLVSFVPILVCIFSVFSISRMHQERVRFIRMYISQCSLGNRTLAHNFYVNTIRRTFQANLKHFSQTIGRITLGNPCHISPNLLDAKLLTERFQAH